MRVGGKSVLITGASSGIGRALALEFAGEGADLVVCARREDRLQTLAKEIETLGRRAIAVRCDVCRFEDVRAAVGAAVKAFGKLDIVVANAGFGVVGPVATLTLDDFRRQFETNVFGAIATVQAALPEIRKSRGSVAIMGSVSGHIAPADTAPYSASKFALRGFAEALHYELWREGVGVTLISPGYVASEFRQIDNRGVRHGEAPEPMPSWILLSAESAARSAVRAIARRRKEVVLTMHGKAGVFFKRHVPALVDVFLRRGFRGRPEPPRAAEGPQSGPE